MIPRSEKIISIIGKNGWNLYDITNLPKDKIFTWDEISSIEPARILIKDREYLFAPLKEEGKSLYETYKKTMGLGPAMHFDISEKAWVAIRIKQKVNNKKIALFTRIWSEGDLLFISSPITVVDACPDVLVCNIEDATRMFESYFHIVYPEDFGISTPVPIPSVFN